MRLHLFLFLPIMIFSVSTASLARDIKVITFNVWHGMNRATFFTVDDYESAERREKRFAIFVESARKMAPDVLAIQEANTIPGYVKKLSKSLDYRAVWRITNCGIKLFGCGIPSNFSEGLAVLAKKEHRIEYLASKRISGGGIQCDYFSFHTSSARYILAAKATIDNRLLLIFNIHAHFTLIPHEGVDAKIDTLIAKEKLPPEGRKKIVDEISSGYQKTENEILQLLSFVKEITAKHNYPYIITGDFNTTAESPAVRKMIQELGLIDAFALKNPGAPGYTWNPFTNPNARLYDGSPCRADGKTPRKGVVALEAEFDRSIPRRIDFILLSKHFDAKKVKSARIVFNEPKDGLLPSDHYGVEVILEDIPRP